MKAIYKGHKFSIVWNIINRSTEKPFDFTGLNVSVGMYSDSCRVPLKTYNIENGTITAQIEPNTLPTGVYNLMCRYASKKEQAYCVYRNAFQITSRQCIGSDVETINLTSVVSHIDSVPEEELPKECQLIAEELFGDKFRSPQLTADRAIADEHGNRIPDTYVTRRMVEGHIKQIYNQQFNENPPLIMKGYITPEMLSKETREMLEATGQEITNLPDGEDLQSIHGVLKLANKKHNPNSYSGLGRQYLRKNIVAGVNVLTQSMIQWPNTIYIIQYDYDLQGAEITIPEGCVLDFQGGSLSNGVVVGDKTSIEASSVRIFNRNITLNGTWSVTKAYAEWFDAKGDGITDDRLAIQKALDSFDIVELQNRVYYIASYTDDNICIKIDNGKNLIGIKRFDSDAFKKATIKLASASIMGNNAIAIACGSMCELKDFAIKGNNSPMDFSTTNQCCGITNIGSMNYKVKIEDVDVETFYYGVNIAAWMSAFIRVGAKACKYGIAIHAQGSSSTHGVMDLNSPHGIVTEMTSNILSQCYCNDCFINGYYLYGVIYSSIISCAADGCGTFVRANWSGYPEDMTKMTDSNTHHPYYFNKCRVVNMSACGSEGCVKLIQTESCWNMTIDGIMVYMLQQEDFFYTNWIKSTNDNAVTLKNIGYFTIPWRLDTKFINVSGGAIELDNIVSADYGTYVSRRLVNVSNNASVVLSFFDEPEKIEITTLKDPGTNETFYNMYQLGNALKGFLMCKSNPKNITYNVDVTGYGISVQSQSVKGWKDNLYLYGTSKETEKSNIHILPSTNYGSTFENFNSIVFKDLWMYLYSTDYTVDYMFKFIDCPSVVFENVKFGNINTSYITKWFESSGNTNIVFKNCTLPDGSVAEYAIWGGTNWVKFSSPTVS